VFLFTDGGLRFLRPVKHYSNLHHCTRGQFVGGTWSSHMDTYRGTQKERERERERERELPISSSSSSCHLQEVHHKAPASAQPYIQMASLVSPRMYPG